ncbi:MAG: HAD-IIA family hydrolase [Acidobacteria bacterium]|nr:HAD-IIA family hydrolase [Acidobacteriota bacterium]
MTSGGNAKPLIAGFDAVLSDLDGVVYSGPHAIPGAVEALTKLKNDGVKLAYVTNNASRTPAQVADHLTELGAPATEETVVSSSQVGAALLAGRYPAGSKVLIIGSAALAREVELVGLVPVHRADDGAAVVIQGFDPNLGWKDLAEASFAIQNGADWVATNTDATIPQARGVAPGNGSLVAAVAAATGVKPTVAGKPEAPLFNAAAERLGAKVPLVVGDRLDTDIRGGNNAKMATAMVLTGIDSRESVLAACTAERPTFLLPDLSHLFSAYPAVTESGTSFTCGDSTAEVVGETVRIHGSKDNVDSWRAACAAWWEANPDAESATYPQLQWNASS